MAEVQQLIFLNVGITCAFWVVFIEVDCKIMRHLYRHQKKKKKREQSFRTGNWLQVAFWLSNKCPLHSSGFKPHNSWIQSCEMQSELELSAELQTHKYLLDQRSICQQKQRDQQENIKEHFSIQNLK